MAYNLKLHEAVDAGIKRVVLEQIDRAVGEIDNRDLDRLQAVHQVRKRCKKIRAVIRLVRPCLGGVYEGENAWFRDTARGLSHLRDTEAMFEAVDALGKEFGKEVGNGPFGVVRLALRKRLVRNAGDDTNMKKELTEARRRMREARARVQDWTLAAGEFDAVGPGFMKTYRRGRSAMSAAMKEPDADNFHEWRKRARYHWYHNRLLRGIWKPVMRRVRREAAALSDLLGDDHDLAVLRGTLLDAPAEFGGDPNVRTLLDLIDRRSAKLRTKAERLGRRVYAEKPKQIRKRHRKYWKAWRENAGNIRARNTCSAAVPA